MDSLVDQSNVIFIYFLFLDVVLKSFWEKEKTKMKSKLLRLHQ